MSSIYGLLGMSDTDRAFVNTIGQSVVYEAIVEQMRLHNEDMSRLTSTFVARQTESFKFRYKLPGNTRLPEVGKSSPPPAMKLYGYWDVAFPLKQYGAQQAGNRVDLAYMSLQALDRHLDAVMYADIERYRWEVLHRILDNVQETFTDDIHGNLSVEPLANGDTVTYPPVVGSNTEATDDHYLTSLYTEANVSETNNPLVTMRDELNEHFGGPSQGGDNVVVFGDASACDEIQAGLTTSFVPVSDRYTQEGDATAQPFGFPGILPGIIRGRSNGVWVVEWRWVSDAYLIGTLIDEEAPLIERVDPADTGLGSGLQLVAETDHAPLQGAQYIHRFGLGAGNRLNGVVMQLTESASYTVPSAYT